MFISKSLLRLKDAQNYLINIVGKFSTEVHDARTIFAKDVKKNVKTSGITAMCEASNSITLIQHNTLTYV